jgi:transcription elongation factor GreA
MTRAGSVGLKNELKRLKSVERPKVIEALAEARSHGDLSENADYDAAKDRQAFIEGRIADIEDKLGRAEVVDVSRLSGDKVLFGATVTISDEDGTEVVYQIVGDIEADIKKGRISISSPIARALIGREQGDSVVVKGPKGGEKEYEILTVAFVAEEVIEES